MEPWVVKIRRAIQTGKFTNNDGGRANRWSSCAVREMGGRGFQIPFGEPTFYLSSAGHPLLRSAVPSDKVLEELGMEFAKNVIDDDAKAARHAFCQIKKRCVQLSKVVKADDVLAAKTPAPQEATVQMEEILV